MTVPFKMLSQHCLITLVVFHPYLRAPVLVALALIESGMKYEDAVQFIRKRRRGAINSKQLEYLEKYKPTKVLKGKEKNQPCCIQ